MIRLIPSRATVAAVLAAVLIVGAGSVVVASNMGFKLNKGLYPPNAAKPGAGDVWTSIPYLRPYNTYADLCTQLGLPNVATRVLQINPETGATQSCQCGAAGCANLRLDLANLPAAQQPAGVPAPYLGVQIRNANFIAGSSSAIIVGSHNPTQQIFLRRIPSAACGDVTAGASANIGATFLSVPYHTTAITAQDLCIQLGLPAGPSAVITRIDPVNGNQPPVTCNTAGAAALNLVLGEAIKIRRATSTAATCAAIASIPAHF